MSFPGGSAWAMAQSLADGHQTVTDRTFRTMTRGELDKLGFEIERCLRDLRGDQPSLDDLNAIQQRNRKLQRLNSARMVMRTYRQKNRK